MVIFNKNKIASFLVVLVLCLTFGVSGALGAEEAAETAVLVRHVDLALLSGQQQAGLIKGAPSLKGDGNSYAPPKVEGYAYVGYLVDKMPQPEQGQVIVRHEDTPGALLEEEVLRDLVGATYETKEKNSRL